MSDNFLVSVIIPVYNVEPYLKQCFDSVVNQTLKNIEIIIVSDGPESCNKICEEYAAKDSRIKIIHDVKKGLGGARNAGMKIAQGKYIYFIDSDDFIDLDYLEKMVKALEDNNVDIVINNKVLEYTNGFDVKRWPFNYFPNGFKEVGNSPFLFPSMAWCKLYRKAYLDTINAAFPDYLKHEDHYFDATTLVFTQKVFIIDSSAYHYRQRRTSQMADNTDGIKIFDMIAIFKQIFNFYKANDLLEKYKLDFNNLKYHLENHINKDSFLTELSKYFKEIEKDVFNVRHLYTKQESVFFDNVLTSKNYKEFITSQNTKTYKLYLFDLIPVVVKKEIK